MKIKICSKFLLLLGAIHSINNCAFAVSSSELIEKSKEYDQQVVDYRGEVVGEVMVRGDYAWLNVHDGINAIGIWSPTTVAKEIKFTGNYKYRGDRVEITGVFNRACRQHGGDLDIHAQRIAIFKQGHEIYHPLNHPRLTLGIILSAISLVLIGLNTYLKKRRIQTKEQTSKT